MDKQEIQNKTGELRDVLVKYKSDLGTLEKKLLKIVEKYHEALKEEKLKELRTGMVQSN